MLKQQWPWFPCDMEISNKFSIKQKPWGLQPAASPQITVGVFMVATSLKSLAADSRTQTDIQRLTLALLPLLLRRVRTPPPPSRRWYVPSCFQPSEAAITTGGELKYNNRQLRITMWAPFAPEVVFQLSNYSFLHNKHAVTAVTSSARAVTFSLGEY